VTCPGRGSLRPPAASRCSARSSLRAPSRGDPPHGTRCGSGEPAAPRRQSLLRSQARCALLPAATPRLMGLRPVVPPRFRAGRPWTGLPPDCRSQIPNRWACNESSCLGVPIQVLTPPRGGQHVAGGRRGKERVARNERSSDWRRGAAGLISGQFLVERASIERSVDVQVP